MTSLKRKSWQLLSIYHQNWNKCDKDLLETLADWYMFIYVLFLQTSWKWKAFLFSAAWSLFQDFKVTLVPLGLQITGLTKRYEESFYNLWKIFSSVTTERLVFEAMERIRCIVLVANCPFHLTQPLIQHANGCVA